jgi:CBS-domain-containing membrane protein
MSPEAALPSFRIESGISIAQALLGNETRVTLTSPALDVMTDLTRVRAATAHPSTSLAQAEQMMILQGVRMLFVVSRVPQLEGLVTFTDLHGDRQLQAVHDRHLRYDELSISDVMSGLSTLDAVSLSAMHSATVGNVVATLKRYGRNHMLVVEEKTAQAPQRVRGVLSRSQIERQLGEAIDIVQVANTFADIERALG